jgi:predicted secreted hydrolase
MSRRLLIVCLLVGCATPSASQDSDPSANDGKADSFGASACRTLPENAMVHLPADDAPHANVPIEWWYWNGHLYGDDDNEYGFQFSFVQMIDPASGTLVRQLHQALTDVNGNQYHPTISVQPGGFDSSTDGFNLAVNTATAVGANGSDSIHGVVDGYSVDLQLESEKAPVLHFGSGYTKFPSGGDTFYYSRERMIVVGAIQKGDSLINVIGVAWFDHQWGNILGGFFDPNAIADGKPTGWDWLGLQLDNDRELMFGQMRSGDNIITMLGTDSNSACVSKDLTSGDFTMTPSEMWTSPASGHVYPTHWTVKYKGRSYELSSLVREQEMPAPGNIYYEGSASVDGSAQGRAYMEAIRF